MARYRTIGMALVLALMPAACQPQVIAPLEEEWGNLEGTWRFRTDPREVGEQEGWQQPAHDDSGWRRLRVPGYWEEQGVTDPRPGEPPRPKNGLAWTDYDGVAWYRLRFIVPAAWEGRDLVLRLGSVDDEDRTFLNGHLVGETGKGIERAVMVQRRYRVPAAHVRFGRENVLAVQVRDGGGPGGLIGPLLTLLPTDLWEKSMKLPQADRPLEERFADPPAESRILPIIHSWPDAPDAQDELIRSMLARGFGGVVCNVSFEQYLESEEKWQAFVRAVKAAKAAGMALWLYDERGYPSGAAGGLTLRDHPEWEARGLLITQATTEGGPLEIPLPPGRLVLAAAYPIAEEGLMLDRAVSLEGQVKEGKLSWTAPAGRWQVLCFTEDHLYEGTHAAVSLADKMPYPNLLQPEPTARFLEVTHARYAQHLGEDLSRWFVATFTDEPSLMSMFMRPMPYQVLPWAPNLPGEFAKRRGYALAPLLPALVADAGARGRQARYDFWLTVAELTAESFFGQIQEACARYRLASGGHLLCEESLLTHVPLYGDLMRCARRLDAPSIDCLTSIPAEVPWFIARTLSSIAELNAAASGRGTPGPVMCETSDHSQRYRPQGDTRPVREVTEEEIRGTCNRLLVSGVNVITSYYSFAGISPKQLRQLNQWVGRCATMLTGGHQVADIAVLYPIESVWPRFVPARNGATDAPAALQVESAYRAALDALWANRRDFTVVDSEALRAAKVEEGALTHGPLRWRVLVLPGADTLPQAAWENVARFWHQGGVVIALGALPANSEADFPSPRVQALAREIFGSPTGPRIQANAAGGAGIFLPLGSALLLPAALDAVLAPDLSVADRQAPLRATHRRIEGQEVYFLINDSDRPWEGRVSLAAQGPGEQWDPGTGKQAPVASAANIPLSLPAYGATLLRFATARPPQRRRVESGALPGFALQDLPPARLEVGKGEFVQAEWGDDPAHSAAGRPAWRTVGTLTRGNVDTFLFASLHYEQPVDLSGFGALAFDSWVPEGQQTPARLLVMLNDAAGRQCYADTGRVLSPPGHSHSLVALSAFQPSPWTQGPEGPLDWRRIRSIVVGWGGYFGTEGERVEFSVAAPQGARLPSAGQ
jgi:hypothetical protein